MPWFDKSVKRILASMGDSKAEAFKTARGMEVRAMWEKLMRDHHDEIILAHTNNVYIVDPAVTAQRRKHEAENGGAATQQPRKRYRDDGKDASATGEGKQLIVYVDDSIVSAELNARRELIKLQFLDHFGEEIDEFKIIISRGEYKEHHPFAPTVELGDRDNVPSVSLDAEEEAALCAELEKVDDPKLRESLRRAMKSDLEWKKGVSRTRGNAAGNDEEHSGRDA